MIAACAVLGLQILEFFNISLQSFQVGGGMLLLISAMNMLNALPAEAKPPRTSWKKAPEKPPQAAALPVVPLTIPLLTGPASMSTVVIYADRAQTFWQHAALVGYGVVIAPGHGPVFSLAPDCPRAGQDRHQRDDAADGPDPENAVAVEVMADGWASCSPLVGRTPIVHVHRLLLA